MAAYSAVVSFGQLLEQLLNSDQLPPNSDLQSFHKNISSLQTSVQTIFPAPKNDRTTASTLETQIRDVIYQAQDAVEYFIAGKPASIPLQEITTEIDPIAAKAATLAASIKKEREKWEEGDIPPPPRSGIISRPTRIVGQEEDKKLDPSSSICFLYMGVFPRKYRIPRSKLINMWKIDGFLELNAKKSLYPSEMECLDELALNNLIMIYQRTTDSTAPFGGKQIIKACGLHSSLWYLANKIGRNAKFFHVLNSLDDCFGEGIESQKRLSFHNNVLFGVKDVHESVEDKCASTAHSLLCYGPYHQYQVPICFGLRLLKKLDAVTIRFYEFPLEILQLVRLKYLALTLDGKLPSSISQLLNLQFLIVNRQIFINSCSDPSYLPVEIWEMKELQQLWEATYLILVVILWRDYQHFQM